MQDGLRVKRVTLARSPSPLLLGSWCAACAHKAVIRPNVHHMQSPFNRTKERLFVLRLVRLPIDGSSKVWPPIKLMLPLNG